MNKLLLLTTLLLSTSFFQLNAQCTIIPGCSIDPIYGYCTLPQSGDILPNAIELVPYNTTIQISLGTTAYNGSVPIITASLTSVSGFPAGMTYSFNPSSGVMPGGSNACLLLSGTPALGTAGIYYPITADFDVNSGASTQSVTWPLYVDFAGTVGVRSFNQVSNLFISPNPANAELFVSSSSHFGKVNIIDALGKTVLSHDANYANQTSINISSLSKGVYFLQVNNGTNVTTKKFIKE